MKGQITIKDKITKANFEKILRGVYVNIQSRKHTERYENTSMTLYYSRDAGHIGTYCPKGSTWYSEKGRVNPTSLKTPEKKTPAKKTNKKVEYKKQMNEIQKLIDNGTATKSDKSKFRRLRRKLAVI